MKALVKYAEGKGNVKLAEVPAPRCGSGQVKILVKAAGICGSDIHIWHGDIAIPMKLPVVMGHEFSGVIVETGEQVRDYHLGDRVTAETTFESCGQCRYCRSDNYNLCSQRRGIGYWYDGAFTEQIIINQERLYRLGDSLSFQAGAMSEPLSCVTHAVLELTQIKAGELVVIFGPGPIGLLALQVVNSLGAQVYLCGMSKDSERLELGRRLGAANIINVEKESVGDVVAEKSKGMGADVVLECSGSGAAAEAGFEIVRKGGRYTQIGLFGGPVSLDFSKIAYKEIKATGSFSQKRSAWLKSMELLERGAIQLEPLISDRFSLADWEKAFGLSQSGDRLKVMFSLDSDAT